MSKQNLSINDLLTLAQKVQNLESGNKQARVKDDSKTNIKSDTSGGIQYINFSPIEIELLKKHQEIFSADTKIGKLLFTENIENKNSFNLTAATEQQKLKNIIKLTSILARKTNSIDETSVGKLFELSNWHKPEMTITQALKLMKTHLDGNAREPLNKFFKDIKFPEQITDAKNWYNLILKNKNAGSVLFSHSEHFDVVPKTYEQGLEKLAGILFPRFLEIKSLADDKLSGNITKAKLEDFTKKIIESNALGDEKNNKITVDNYNQALDILINPDLKSSDELPNILIDGADIGPEFAKYYLAKLPAGDPRGLILGKLTNCCQSISDAAAQVAIHGATQQNSGFYVIFEKHINKQSGNVININEDRIIAQSFAWLGENKDELVLDSWERLGEDNNKLMEPFYSKLATQLNQSHNIKKVYIGHSDTLPETIPYIKSEEYNNIKFNGEHPYPNDSIAQSIILDEKYSRVIDFNRLLLNKQTNDTAIEQFALQNFNSAVEDLLKFFKEQAVLNSVFKSTIFGNKLEILQLLLKNHAEFLSDYMIRSNLYTILKNISDSDLIYKTMQILSNSYKDMISTFVRISTDSNNITALKALIEKDFDLKTKILKDDSENDILSYVAQYNYEKTNILNYLLTKDFDKDSIISALKVIPPKTTSVNLLELLLEKLHNTIGSMQIPIQEFFDFKQKVFDNKLFEAVIKASDIEFITYLINKGANLNIYEDLLISSIHYPSAIHSTDITKILLQNSDIAKHVNYVNESGQSAIHIAIEKGNISSFQLLLDYGADINLLNNEGQSPLIKSIIALYTSHDEENYANRKKITDFLLEKGANPHIKDNQGKTVIEYCREIEVKDQLTIYLKNFDASQEFKKAPTYFASLNCQETNELNHTTTEEHPTDIFLGGVVENSDQ